MTGFWLALFFLFGVTLGSFLNVVSDRLPQGKSIIWPSSHCPACQSPLKDKDLIPIFSYLWLKGHCRYCGAPIPIRLLWVESGTGILFAFLYWHYGLTWELAMFAFYCCLFIALLVIDFEHGILPNRIVYPGIVIALIVAIFGSIFGFAPGIVTGSGFSLWIVDAAVGAGIGFGFLFLVAIFSKGGMGWGDVKLAGLIGLVTGFPLVFVALFLAVVGGGVIAGILLITRVKKRKETMPFGPFLSLAAMATLFWGESLLHWYQSLA